MDDKFGYALILAVVGLAGKYLVDWLAARNQAKAFQQAILAEIYALLSLIKARDYRKFLDEGVFTSEVCKLIEDSYLLSMNIQDNYCPVYYNNLDKIQLLNKNNVKDIVLFHALIASLVQDLKPGGACNNKESSSPEVFESSLKILDQATLIGERIIGGKVDLQLPK